MADIIISTSILSADFSQLGEQIRKAEKAGADWIHVDVMDGHFVPNITMGPFIVEACREITDLPIDVHLMIEHPELYVEDFASAGASRMSVHIESSPNIHRTLQHVRACGCHPGIVLNPGTPAVDIVEVIPLIDLVLVMTVNPGYSGQEFIPETVGKISQVKDLLQSKHSSAIIQVDGGITHETLPMTYAAGARAFVAATAIFKYPGGIASGIQALRAAVS
jgi:ribulose-phosphate 3-epimerase